MPDTTPDRRQVLAASLAVMASSATLAGASPRHRVLLVATNVGAVGERTSGTFLMEIALPFARLRTLGYDVDVVSPRGGPAAVYHSGEVWPELVAARDDPAFVSKTAETLAAASVQGSRYRAMLYPGGHGQFWDVVDNADIAAAASRIHRDGGVIATVGHGAASLVNIRTSDGRYLVSGKRMTCFPTWAEKTWMEVSDFGRWLPFDMEAVLRARGADLVVCTRETMRDPSVTLLTDTRNRLVTGAFATSALAVADRLHALLAAPNTPETSP